MVISSNQRLVSLENKYIPIRCLLICRWYCLSISPAQWLDALRGCKLLLLISSRTDHTLSNSIIISWIVSIIVIDRGTFFPSFNMVVYSSSVRKWQESLVPCTVENVAMAVQWISQLKPEGSSCLLNALKVLCRLKDTSSCSLTLYIGVTSTIRSEEHLPHNRWNCSKCSTRPL